MLHRKFRTFQNKILVNLLNTLLSGCQTAQWEHLVPLPIHGLKISQQAASHRLLSIPQASVLLFLRRNFVKIEMFFATKLQFHHSLFHWISMFSHTKKTVEICIGFWRNQVTGCWKWDPTHGQHHPLRSRVELTAHEVPWSKMEGEFYNIQAHRNTETCNMSGFFSVKAIIPKENHTKLQSLPQDLASLVNQRRVASRISTMPQHAAWAHFGNPACVDGNHCNTCKSSEFLVKITPSTGFWLLMRAKTKVQ